MDSHVTEAPAGGPAPPPASRHIRIAPAPVVRGRPITAPTGSQRWRSRRVPAQTAATSSPAHMSRRSEAGARSLADAQIDHHLEDRPVIGTPKAHGTRSPESSLGQRDSWPSARALFGIRASSRRRHCLWTGSSAARRIPAGSAGVPRQTPDWSRAAALQSVQLRWWEVRRSTAIGAQPSLFSPPVPDGGAPASCAERSGRST